MMNSRWSQFLSQVPLQNKTVQQDDIMRERQSAVLRKTKTREKLQNLMESGDGGHNGQLESFERQTLQLCVSPG